MRLADFILRDMEHIGSEWEAFAATRLPAAGRTNSLALRDHAEPILRAVAMDLRTVQTGAERVARLAAGTAPSQGRRGRRTVNTVSSCSERAPISPRCAFAISRDVEPQAEAAVPTLGAQ